MLNSLWAAMILIGISYGAATGNLTSITEAALSSSKEAITLSITMLGVTSLWSGIMEIAANGGILEHLSQKMQPLLHFLFPKIPKNHPALQLISTNMIANIFGLGWAAAPAGLKAMEELKKLKPATLPLEIASSEMCTFLVINISSLQLIPVNIIAYRSQYGSVAPAAIVGPAIIATLASTTAAVIFCKVMNKNQK